MKWISDHPQYAVYFWLALTAVLTTLFKPQTPEQYAKIAMKHPRLADVWRLIGSLGIDPVKAALLIRELVRSEPPTLFIVTDPPPKLPTLNTPVITDDEDTIQ